MALLAFSASAIYLMVFAELFPTRYEQALAQLLPSKWPADLDKDAYNTRMLALSRYVTPIAATTTSTTTPRNPTPMWTATTSVSIPGMRWPPPTVYPHGGALLPFNRIVAYYGNFYSKQMGVLGEYAPQEVLQKLASTTAAWEAADPSTPVIPAIHYIAMVAQGSPGADGKYRARMPDAEIDKALGMANHIHGLLFIDLQVGLSNLEAELPTFEKYLMLPNVHLGIDPEFAMHNGRKPGIYIGTLDAADVNFSAAYLASLVQKYKLPPKVLVVHRFTKDMVTRVSSITPLPEVQIVMDMDGWGPKEKKFGTYNAVIEPEPVQFTGMKLFYHADLRSPSTGMLSPEEVLSKATPIPSYIQYQ